MATTLSAWTSHFSIRPKLSGFFYRCGSLTVFIPDIPECEVSGHFPQSTLDISWLDRTPRQKIEFLRIFFTAHLSTHMIARDTDF
jgi:hypothetical protein